MKYILLTLLTIFSTSAFSSDNSSNSSFATIIPHVESHTLSFDTVKSFLKQSPKRIVPDTFCIKYEQAIIDYASAIHIKKNPSLREIEHACASLLLLSKIQDSHVERKELLDRIGELLNNHLDGMASMITIAEQGSDRHSIETGLNAIVLIEAIVTGAGLEAACDITSIKEKRSILDERLKRLKICTSNTPANAPSNSSLKAGVIRTIGAIALIAATVYYFSYVKPDSKAAKAILN